VGAILASLPPKEISVYVYEDSPPPTPPKRVKFMFSF
jgi:hypothetical protein